MCGISGIYHYGEPARGIDRDALLAATRSLAHRGPDGEGIWVDGAVGLGHRRLAIVDLTNTGCQPMGSSTGRCWISFNGEFYTHREYRRRLEGRGVTFRGSSDTETLVNLLELEGLRGLGQPSAIFAFAFWDGRRRELTLARDPLGVKQLYYHDDGRRVVFASEIKALFAWPDVPRRPDLEGLNQYLHFHTPLHDRTLFQGIQQVQPGEAMVFSPGRRQARFWWRLDVEEPPARRGEEAIDELKGLLSEVVRDQLLSDVPVGAFFSGGIDSSAVAAFAVRNGHRPKLFGVHFEGQGVVDEGPFQTAAAKAMGLDLNLITVDPASFPDDMVRLIEAQDQPVIGPAFIPMYHVSRLAAREVKVCLGGQAADEIFGGYARYALTRPWDVLRSWRARGAGGESSRPVGGNLRKQLLEGRTLKRLARNAGLFGSWQDRYFENFAVVPEEAWTRLFPGAGVSRHACRELFGDRVRANGVADPATAAMLWDVQTYLPGLFHQDDRMSMANGLESRVPLADPRVVKFAFSTDFGLKFRGGASKWILRQAVSETLPPEVLTRRKVGFDTPVEAWMRGPHLGFVKDLLLSKGARERGLLDSRELERLIADPHAAHGSAMLWKALCLELWARRFLDSVPTPPSWVRTAPLPEARPRWRDYLQELRELGPGETLFRASWELQRRSGFKAVASPAPPELSSEVAVASGQRLASLQVFGLPEQVVAAVSISPTDRDALLDMAQEAGEGRIRCFSRWQGDFGDPPDWHRNPVSGTRWRQDIHWSLALRDEARAGDVKLTWELGRFPHAFPLARAAARVPEHRERFAGTFRRHVEGFLASNPPGLGIHWASGQEFVFRFFAWLFAIHSFRGCTPIDAGFLDRVVRHLYLVAHHLEKNLDYARKSVYNNHLLSEALGLRMLGDLFRETAEGRRWRALGGALLEEQAALQFSPDGGYIQNSHNYHRVAVHILLVAGAWMRAQGEPVPPSIIRSLAASVGFLQAHQNPADGRLPNYGANDGALPLILSSCDFADYRPVLQAASLASGGGRLFGPGPWDEVAAWLLGPGVLAVPVSDRPLRSVSFRESGYHVLRGRTPESFCTFRAGSLRQRFAQIDMLHLDVWWRGTNVLVDGGTYLYNGEAKWHDHFLRTGSHNTVKVDGRDQMLHLRRFKSVYLTRARSTGVQETGGRLQVEGEHDGYLRHPGAVKHRRQVFFLPDDLWIVADTLTGKGEHDLRLQWLGAPLPWREIAGGMNLDTPGGPFQVRVFDVAGVPVPPDLAAGEDSPPRGWVSRYYGEKVAAPSLVANVRVQVPFTFISVLCGGQAEVRCETGVWTVTHPCGKMVFTCESTGIEVRHEARGA